MKNERKMKTPETSTCSKLSKLQKTSLIFKTSNLSNRKLQNNALKRVLVQPLCIAVTVDRHQNIMSSVALKRGVEEPWTIERLSTRLVIARSRSERHEPAIMHSEVEVATGDAVKGDKPSKGHIEGHSNATAGNHQNDQIPH